MEEPRQMNNQPKPILERCNCSNIGVILNEEMIRITEYRKVLKYNSIEDIEKQQEYNTLKWVLSLIDNQ